MLVCLIFAGMTGLWCCWAGKVLVSHPAVSYRVQRYGLSFAPFVLMAIGGYVLIRGGALHLVGG
jgi:cadmium resistance protein CadD (predicted permease)